MKRILIALETPRGLALALLALGIPLYGALLFRYVTKSPFAGAPFLDARYYWNLAVDTGARGLPLPDVLFNAPLYPLFLAAWVRAFGAGLGPVYALQAALCLATVLLLSRVAARLFSPREAIWAGLLGIFYGPLAFQALKILPEALALALFSAFLFLFTRPEIARRAWGPAALGLTAGLCVLARSQLLLPVLAAAPFLFARDAGVPARRRLARAAVFLAALALTLAPWGLRNLARTGHFTLLAPNGGITFYEGNNPAARGAWSQVLDAPDDLETRFADMRERASRDLGRPVDLAGADRYFRDQALAWIVSSPGDWLRLTAVKALMILRPRELPLVYDLYGEQREFAPWLKAFFAGWGILLPLALAGLWDAARPRRSPFFAPFAAMAACLVLTLLLFLVVSRYRLLLLPVALPLAARGPGALAAWWKSGRRGLAVAGAVLLAAGAAGQALDRPGPEPWSDEMGAKALARSGRMAEAEARFLAVLAQHPDRASTLNGLVVLFLWEGRLNEAETRVRELSTLPGQADRAAYYQRVMEQARQRFGGPGAGNIRPTPEYHDFLDQSSGEEPGKGMVR